MVFLNLDEALAGLAPATDLKLSTKWSHGTVCFVCSTRIRSRPLGRPVGDLARWPRTLWDRSAAPSCGASALVHCAGCRARRPVVLLPGGLATQLRSRKAAARAAAATRAARASVRVVHKANKAGLGKGEP
jgi:hypothetical protein